MSDSKHKQLQQYQESILGAKDQEATVAEALSTPIQHGLPTTWQDGAGNHKSRGTDTLVKTATQKDVANYAFAPARVCGTCKFFQLTGAARKKLVEERFAERLVYDERWKLKYLGVPLDNIGLCGASNGEKACTSISNASGCDQYRPIRFREAK